MPHVTLDYSPELEPALEVQRLCDALCTAIGAQRDADGRPVFPLGGTRVFARPARAAAVADGDPSHAFLYVNVRIAPGRSPETVRAAGEALARAVEAAIAPLLDERTVGWTLQVDERAPAFDHKGRGQPEGDARRAAGRTIVIDSRFATECNRVPRRPSLTPRFNATAQVVVSTRFLPVP
jgi:5-carboxymethyl-2-hydroxymuconate isomerase